MALSITATADNTTATVAVEISGGTGDFVYLLRSDANGTNPVRLYNPSGFTGGSLSVVDSEAALSGLLVYSVAVGTETASDSVSFSGITSPWLSPVTAPSMALELDAILNYGSRRETNSTVHTVIDREDPVVSFGAYALRTGTLDIYSESYAFLRDIEQLIRTGEILHLRQVENAGMDMYFLGTATMAQPLQASLSLWNLIITYVEVPYPLMALRGSGDWTIADALARNALIINELYEFPLISDGVAGP